MLKILKTFLDPEEMIGYLREQGAVLDQASPFLSFKFTEQNYTRFYDNLVEGAWIVIGPEEDRIRNLLQGRTT